MRAALFALLIAPSAAAAVTCEDRLWQGTSYTACKVTADEDLRLFLNDASGRPLGSFAAIEEATGKPLLFAMNAGMYHPDRSPVGWYVEDGVELAPVVKGASPGNFGMLPNGIFCITASGETRVLSTDGHIDDAAVCRFATQSGPMLVMGEDLHPRFIPGSSARQIRNGVGTDYGDETWFVISNQPVNFWDFARFFRDGLGLHNALYLDGSISRLYAPMLDRTDGGFPMGPMVGVLAR